MAKVVTNWWSYYRQYATLFWMNRETCATVGSVPNFDFVIQGCISLTLTFKRKWPRQEKSDAWKKAYWQACTDIGRKQHIVECTVATVSSACWAKPNHNQLHLRIETKVIWTVWVLTPLALWQEEEITVITGTTFNKMKQLQVCHTISVNITHFANWYFASNEWTYLHSSALYTSDCWGW